MAVAPLNMVRRVVEYAITEIPPEKITEILEAKDRAAAGPTAPAKGLTLVGMEYEEMI